VDLSEDAEIDLTHNIQRWKGESVWRRFIIEFHAVLKEQQDKGTGSGELKHVAQWRSEGNVMDDECPAVTGNAASAAKQVTKTVYSA
jgi:hypothetical protein